MMNITIDQNNLYLLLPSKVSWLANRLTEEKGFNIVDAMRTLYASHLYKKLEDESSKIWHLGPVALYEDFEMEQRNE